MNEPLPAHGFVLACTGHARLFDRCVAPAIDGSERIGVTLRATDVTDVPHGSHSRPSLPHVP